MKQDVKFRDGFNGLAAAALATRAAQILGLLCDKSPATA
jgi:hypothetical protein